MEKLNDSDLALIQLAKDVISKNFDEKNNSIIIGSALRCKNGNIYTGVNLRFTHGACAEVIATGSAITAGERELDCIVAVGVKGEVLPPCGNCRQMLYNFSPGCYVIMDIRKELVKIKLADLIPFAYEMNDSWKMSDLLKKLRKQ